METLLATGSALPDPDAALRQATQFGDLAYVLVLGMLLFSGIVTLVAVPVVFKAIIPWAKAKREREDKIADSHVENLRVSNETQTKMVVIMEGIQDDHRHFRDEVRGGFDKVNSRLDGICRRRPDDPSQPPPNHRPN